MWDSEREEWGADGKHRPQRFCALLNTMAGRRAGNAQVEDRATSKDVLA